jgi:hypothetical protein
MRRKSYVVRGGPLEEDVKLLKMSCKTTRFETLLSNQSTYEEMRWQRLKLCETVLGRSSPDALTNIGYLVLSAEQSGQLGLGL